MGRRIIMKESKEKIIGQAEGAVLHTYNRYPVVLDHGEGVCLYDTEGKRYLDFAAGIAVQALGYHYPGYDEALKEQIDRLLHTSNLYYNEPAAEAAEKLVKMSGMSRVFFTNSGTEAVEGAIKAAKKYAWLKDGRTDHEVIAMRHSFHGRSVGALSVTGNEAYQTPFLPLMGGVRFADYNDLESVKEQFNERTCAVILETVQGEGGVVPAEADFLEGVRKLCTEHDVLLILDEIQCGMGRCGALFAWQKYGVEPDIMTCAKALGCGVPVGAFLLNEKTASASLAPGDHGTTYGGNPFVCAAVSKVLDIYEQDKIAEHAQQISVYMEKKLDDLAERFDCIRERRGMGLLQGLVIEGRPVNEIVLKSLEEGLIVITAGKNVLRLAPPLIITEADVDEMTEKLERALR